jgi:dipeptidyl aminopeptidase/acylaminoacyl peptidase
MRQHLLSLLALGTALGLAFPAWTKGEPAKNYADLKEARADFSTKLTREGPPPKIYEAGPLPSGAEEIWYESEGRKLMGWRSAEPTDGAKHPAVVFAHGGYFLKETAWEATHGFRDAGYVVLTPALRAENGNPGHFEGFWGEVDDLVAAGEYLASLSFVDPDRVYLSGHSVGGTLAMLGSMYPSRFRAVAASGGCPDTGLFFSYLPAYAPFDRKDKEEIRLRSPIELTSYIQKPLHLFYGDTETVYAEHAKKLCERAQKDKKECKLKIVKGNHKTSVPRAVAEEIKWFESLP